MLHRRVRDERPAARPLSIPGIRLQGGALDNRADAAPRRPRTTGHTKDHGNTRQPPDPPVVRPADVPTGPAGYSTRWASGPAGTRPRDAHRGLLPPGLAAAPATRRGIPALTRPERGNS